MRKAMRSTSPSSILKGNSIPSLYRNYLRRKLQSFQKTEELQHATKKIQNEPNFKVEIERKFSQSTMNKFYVFPRKIITNHD
jgi:hypothetical protein